MLRTRFAIAGVILALLVGVRLATHSSALAQVTAVAATPATPTSDWDITGQIQEMNGQFWDIQGFVVKVTASTSVVGVVPSVGEYASATGTVAPDGTWLASAIQVGDTLASIPTATTTPTNTAVPTATPTATSTSTAQPTATPSAVPPTPTSTARDSDADDDATATPRPPARVEADPKPKVGPDDQDDHKDKAPPPTPPRPKHPGKNDKPSDDGKRGHDD
jgi:hypothetical protein